jgi:hypothetical protein
MGRLLILFALLMAGSALDNVLAWTLIISAIGVMLMLEWTRMKRTTDGHPTQPAE